MCGLNRIDLFYCKDSIERLFSSGNLTEDHWEHLEKTKEKLDKILS